MVNKKTHDTIGKKTYETKLETRIHVVNTTNIPLKVEIFFDIDEYKILIEKDE